MIEKMFGCHAAHYRGFAAFVRRGMTTEGQCVARMENARGILPAPARHRIRTPTRVASNSSAAGAAIDHLPALRSVSLPDENHVPVATAVAMMVP